MFSKPWAWFWTVFMALGCGVGGFLGALQSGLALGWAIAIGGGAMILTGTYCGSYVLGHGTDALPDADGEQPAAPSQ